MSDQSPADAAPARDFLGEARALVGAGRYLPALGLLDEAIALQPGEVDPYVLKADLLYKLGRPLDSAETFEAALALASDHPDANFALGLVYDALGIWEKCVRQWERMIALMPHLPQPYFQAGATFGIHLRQFDRASRLFACLPPVIDGYWLSLVADVKREERAARARVRAALRQRRAGSDLGGVEGAQLVLDLLHLGRPRAAQRLLDGIAARIGETARLGAQFAIDWRVKELETALAAIAGRIDLADAPAELRFMLAEALYFVGDFDRSAAVWRRQPFAELAPHAQEIFWRASFASRDFAEARAIGEAVLALRPYDAKGAQYVLSTMLAEGSLAPVTSAVDDADAAGMPIPPVLFRFWDKPVPPADVQVVLDSWNDPGEGFTQVLFDEASARTYLREHHSERHLATFDACHHPAMKSDFLRLCYLAREGGVYLDVDQARIPGGPSLRRSLAGRRLVLPLSATGPVYTNNNIIAAVPGHPVLLRALDEAMLLIEHYRSAGTKIDIWATTGPGVFTRSLVRHLLAEGAEGAAAGGVALLSSAFLESITALVNDLSYKATAAGNWRLI